MTVSAVRPADPYGQVCRRWSGLSPAERDRAALRLVGVPVGQARIHDPGPGCHGHYAALVEAALAGDEVAFAWLADSHRPLLLSRGRALFDRDPGEWGAASLEVLYRALTIARQTTATGTTDGLEVIAGDLFFEPTELSAPAGTIQIVLDNQGAAAHDLVLEEPGDLTVIDLIDGGTTATGTLDLEPGTYTFYCSVPGHRGAGMEGLLDVSS